MLRWHLEARDPTRDVKIRKTGLTIQKGKRGSAIPEMAKISSGRDEEHLSSPLSVPLFLDDV